MTWTSKKPTVPGFWWYKDCQGNRAVFHVRGAVDMWVFYSEDKLEIPYDIANYNGQWAWPIGEPEV